MNKAAVSELIKRYLAGTCSEEEHAMLESWYLSETAKQNHLQAEPDMERIDRIMQQRLGLRPKRRTAQLWSYAAAAALLIICSLIFLYRPDQVTSGTQQAELAANRLKPGNSKAVLILSNGEQLSLENKKGRLASESGINILAQETGQLVYQGRAAKQAVPAAENVLRIPRGGEYRLVLSDGTRVWLNAGSELRFPAAFTGSSREVSLSGEAYFEVAKDKAHPFKVRTMQTTVTVLGTHFNISAYPEDQQVRTTLLEGSVRINHGRKASVLVPGQEALTRSNQPGIALAAADIDNAIAWKNGYFVFRNERFDDAFRRIARWYDLEVEFQGGTENSRLGGTYSRTGALKDLMESVALTHRYKVRLNGRKITIMK